MTRGVFDMPLEAMREGAASDPLKFLFVVLWGCIELKQTRINLSELRAVWGRLGGIERIKAGLHVALPSQVDLITEKIRDWAKKINKESDIRQLQQVLTGAPSAGKRGKAAAPREPFIAISACSAVGAQVEGSFSHLPLDELDRDEATDALVGAGAG